ncbi:MAG: regulatory protein RecX [Gammaproteobacteria bacterium]|nr:regulatory protein RecX [Gammaproteobacteria bacterium]
MEVDLRQVLRAKALRLLAQREHSRLELAQKLGREHLDLVKQLLDVLASEDLQSDARFTEAFVHSRIVRGQGPIKIRAGLNARGIDMSLAEQCLANHDDSEWLTLAWEVYCKRFGDLLPENWQEQQKRAVFLQQRGFTTAHIRKLWKHNES